MLSFLNLTVSYQPRCFLDADLAPLYGVETKRFNETIKCSAAKFPADFMFQLTVSEFTNLRLQFATSSLKGSDTGHNGLHYLPRVFTLQRPLARRLSAQPSG